MMLRFSSALHKKYSKNKISIMTTSFEETVERVQAMRLQEDTVYLKSVSLFDSTDDIEWSVSAPLTDSYEKIVSWYLRVINFCNFDHEIVEIAATILNMFLITPEGFEARVDPSKYQLASLGAVYIAVKIHANKAMHPKSLAQLSGGRYTASEIEQAEAYMLPALKWRVNPPTAAAFLRELTALLPSDVVDSETRTAIFELAQMQYELLLPLPYFAVTKASLVAFASLVNAMESLDMDPSAEERCIGILAQVLGIHRHCTAVIEAQRELYKSLAVDQPDPSKRSSSPISTLQCLSRKSFGPFVSEASPRAVPLSTMVE